VGDENIKYSEEKPHQNHTSANTFRIGNIQCEGGVGTAHAKGRITIAQIKKSHPQPRLPADKAHAKFKETLWISPCKQDDPKRNERQNGAPQSDEEKAKSMGYKNVQPAEESPQ
jgi:hypothetical protein